MIIGLFLLCSPRGYLWAETFHLDSIRQTTINTIQVQLDAFVSGVYGMNAKMYTATSNPMHKGSSSLHELDLSPGITATIFSTKFSYLRFVCSLGYKYGRFSYDGDFFTNAGIHTHWVTSEWKVGFFAGIIGLEAGVGVDGLLHHQIVNDNQFRYAGFHEDCLNNIRVKGLFGLYLPFSYCTLEFVVGLEIIPAFNTQKMAYYNLTPTECDMLTFGFRLNVPFFSTFSNNNAVKSGKL